MDVSSVSEVEMGKRGLHKKEKRYTNCLLKLSKSLNTYNISKRMQWILVIVCMYLYGVIVYSDVWYFFFSGYRMPMSHAWIYEDLLKFLYICKNVYSSYGWTCMCVLRPWIVFNLIPKKLYVWLHGPRGLNVVVTLSQYCGCCAFLLWFKSDCLKEVGLFNDNSDRTLNAQGFVFLSISDNESSRGQNSNRRR